MQTRGCLQQWHSLSAGWPLVHMGGSQEVSAMAPYLRMVLNQLPVGVVGYLEVPIHETTFRWRSWNTYL